MNQRSIGIEHRGGPDLPISEATYKNSAELVADICKRNNIPLDRTHIIGHREVSATQCPGTLDIDRIINMAKGDGGKVAELEKKIDDLEKQVDELRENRNKYRTLYEESQEKNAEEIQDKNKTIEQLQKQLNEITIQMKILTDELGVAKEEKNSTEGILGALRAKLEDADRNILSLTETQKDLLREIEDLKKVNSKDLKSYSWSDRFRSLFWR